MGFFHGYRPSIFISALLASLVGFGGTVALILSAAEALNATHLQTISWLTAMCLAISFNASVLAWLQRQPITIAWSAPAMALLSVTTDVSLNAAIGAFFFCGFLLLITGFAKQLRNLVSAIPIPLANALLAGILFGFVIRVFPEISEFPKLSIPMIVLFFLIQLWSPAWATLSSLVLGLILSFALGLSGPIPAFVPSQLIWVRPVLDWQVAVSIGLPLYLVTMAGQNLPGLAVLRADGYDTDTRSTLGLTGLTSMITAFFGSSGQNLAAVTAAMCTGPETHPVKSLRWTVGPSLGFCYLVIALCAGWLVTLFANLPSGFIITVAAVGLCGALARALGAAMSDQSLRLPALITFLVAQSNVSFWELGGALWGLALGLALWGLSKLLPWH